MKKNITLVVTFIFVANFCFGQSKNVKKNRKKLEKKFEYILLNKDCSSAIVGKRILGGNDGGGRVPKGVKEVQIASLNEKKIKYWTPPHTKITTKIMNFNNDKYNLRLVSDDGKIGLIHPCKKIVLEPKYDYIGEFNSDGIALALIGNKINVIDLNGKNLIDTATNLSFYNDEQDFPIPYKNTIITNNQSKDNYSLFNLTTNEIISKNKYSYINSNIVKDDNKKIGFIAKRNERETIIDNMGNEIIPLLFETISGTLDNGSFIYGKLPNNEGVNIYDYSKNRFIVPKEIQKDFVYGKHIGDGIWEMFIKAPSSKSTSSVKRIFSVYDVLNNRFVIDSKKSNEYEKDWNQLGLINSKFIKILDKEKKIRIIDRTNSKEMKQFSKGTSFKYLKLKKENIEKVFILSSIQLDKKSSVKTCSMYTSNFEVVFENIKVYPVDVKSKGDYIYLKQNINCYPCKKVYTAYDFDGNMLGEKHQFVLEK